jgi:hypothetical protein
MFQKNLCPASKDNFEIFDFFQVGAALVTAGCGHWVEKPVEQDQFSIDF